MISHSDLGSCSRWSTGQRHALLLGPADLGSLMPMVVVVLACWLVFVLCVFVCIPGRCPRWPTQQTAVMINNRDALAGFV